MRLRHTPSLLDTIRNENYGLGKRVGATQTRLQEELKRPAHETIHIAGKSYPQDLATVLRRVWRFSQRHNRTTKLKDPVYDVRFLQWLQDAFKEGEKWEVTERDEYNLPTRKELRYRHKYQTECDKLLAFAILRQQKA
jgi:hypothetical protein